MIRLVSATFALIVFVAPALLLAPNTAHPQAGPVKIGLLLPYTGPLSVQGTDTTKGFDLYMSKIGMKAGGREIQLLKEDTEAKPDVGLLTITIDTLKGDLSDRNRVKDALRTALPRVKAPRGRLEFDASRQVTAPAYVMRAEKQGGRIVNAIVEKLPPVPQEKVWGWWKK